ncbi:hypothetical protein HDE69_002900 [Pedobacter cryoconitis]|uniref:Uncharacterized protein n=1 Tax=Pedobacter cryoconitis TaxID=188932 RepID=A0A7W8YU47_9SPHI|nr:hypothetical protein [Pedobacter cryoconitis]MBB5621837.1 hypothetical protein [Pedobacter cryoconitis]MBB5644037.1 hypothetical protein [Pedobacter cryoconitis]
MVLVFPEPACFYLKTGDHLLRITPAIFVFPAFAKLPAEAKFDLSEVFIKTVVKPLAIFNCLKHTH